MSSSDHTIVVGGGVIGASAAYYLARRGQRVTLIDREAFDRCASTGNAGIIALGHPPMPRPGLVGRSLRMFFDPLNPLFIPPRFDLDLLRWMWAFRKACSQRHFEHSMAVLAQLGFTAGETFDALVEEEHLDCEYHRTGWLDVFSTEKRFAQGRDEADLIRSYGYDVHIISGEDLRRREPAFKPSVLGAAHYTDSRFANPGAFLRELADRAAKHGATLLTNTEVRSIIVEDGRFTGVKVARHSGNDAQVTTHNSEFETLHADDLILAGGAWTTKLARSIGVDVPMQPGKGYHMDILLPEGAPRVSTTSVIAESFVAVTPISHQLRNPGQFPGLQKDGPNDAAGSRASNTLRLAGTVELSGMNETLVQKRLDMLRVGAQRHLNGIENAQTLSTWCGLRPCTADGLPVIGWAPVLDNVFIATGHAMMGFALGPITGRLVSECILDGKPSVDITALSPSRYVRKQKESRRPRRSTARSAQHLDA